mmetsp:Transcript_8967/g.14623  ORF Transcript_8967/g.14623 Transcript_8967/m.14623 type:complete len:300 (+) Transcript_8967:416-1315(+)
MPLAYEIVVRALLQISAGSCQFYNYQHWTFWETFLSPKLLQGGILGYWKKRKLLSNADYIILASCGFSIERPYEELKNIKILESKEWQDFLAVVGGMVAIADGNKFFNRSSVASIIGTAEIVAEFIYPELRGMYGHHGTRWVRLEELSAFCGRAGAEPTKKDVVLAEGVEQGSAEESTNFKCLPTSKNSMTIQHVMKQIAALQCGDYNAAFLLNSPSNKKRLVSADKFKAIVSGWTSFKMLTFPQTTCEYQEGEVDGTIMNVKVEARAEGSDEILSFVFDLRKSEDGERWETDGVRIEC